MVIRNEALEKQSRVQSEKIKALENGVYSSNQGYKEDSLYLSGTKIEDLSFIEDIVTKRTLDLSEIDL